MYKIYLSNKAEKFLYSLNEEDKKRIKKFLIKFKKDYTSFPYKKLINRKDEFRIRVGKFRILYKKYKDKLIIKIIKIGLRENIYK